MLEFAVMPTPTIFHRRFGVSDDALRDFARRHALREISIFGSASREDFRPNSDVDILIELDANQAMTIERYMAMHDELETLFGRTVDLVEKPLIRNPHRRREILRTREVLYAA